MNNRISSGSCLGRTGKALGFLLLLSVTVSAAEKSPTGKNSSPPPSAPAVPRLPLAECIRIALERQPRIAARRASLASVEDGYQALAALRAPDLLVPELPYRRSQAAHGITAARAGVVQAEQEAVYAVTRAYFTVLFAREQHRLARGVVERLDAIQSTAREMLDEGARNVSANDVSRSLVFLRLAQTRQVEAEHGFQRALAALREAVGLGSSYYFDVAGDRLPDPTAEPCRSEVIAWALARRSELATAMIFAQVVCLEVEAQGTSHRRRMETFAAGSDIHAWSVPQEVRNNEYRPGAVAPEMPTLLVGQKADRVQRARSLYTRAVTVVDVTRNLIALEAEDAFLRWEQAARQARLAREAADTGDKWAESLRKDFLARLRVRLEDVTTAAVTAAQARGQYNEYLYRKIVALADVERATAGAFCARLTEAAPQARLPAPKPVKNDDKEKNGDREKEKNNAGK
jgi:outer membrane protein TolC